jgi:membrane-associated protein
MSTIQTLIDLFLHLDKHLDTIFRDYGIWTYILLALVVFCETGLVVTPFLPGDSLLFAAGALAAGGALNVDTLALALLIAAILGDTVNYHIGKYIGPRVFEKKDSRIFKQAYLKRTQDFYERYGGKTIILARFVPIVRTFAPFLAGVGKMNYSQFIVYNVVGAICWVGSLTYAGYYFGEIAVVKRNFSLVVLGIIFVSILPAVFEIIRVKRQSMTRIKENNS